MTAPTHQLCVIGTREHGAHDGLVCTWHGNELAQMLRDVETEAALLDPRKSLSSHGSTKSPGLAHESSPVRLDALVLTDHRRNAARLTQPDHDPLGMDDTPEVLDVLGSWARLVREEQHLTAPDGPATLSSERTLLSRQLPWIVAQCWVDELHTELRELLTTIKRVNGTLILSAGRCETIRNAQECGGLVYDVVIHHDDGGPDEPGFRCNRCRETWLGTAAIRKRDQLARQA